MVTKYQNISIIYGASGKDCAKRIHDELCRRHTGDFYPIKSHILANEILNSSTILETVKGIISSSAACIVILTFDDVEHTRVRQNVLVEIGMAMMLIDKNNCFFISERQTLPDDFPSDLKGVINPNYFDKSDPDGVVQKTCDAVIAHLGVSTNQNILESNDYIYDYKRILDDIPVEIFDKNANAQLEALLHEWEQNIASFEFVSERIMYLLERIKFFPDFNCDEMFFGFLDRISDLVRPRDIDFHVAGADRTYLIKASNFILSILDYSKIKLDHHVLACLASPKDHPEEIRTYRAEFRRIGRDLQTFIDEFESGQRSYNWMIRIMAYEYSALSYMKYLVCVDRYDEAQLELMNYIISCYKKTMAIGNENDPYSNTLWQGYAQYNLTRAYVNLYKITGNDMYLEDMADYSISSINTRRNWFKNNNFKGVFSNALSYEYFLVCKYEYELRYKIPAYSMGTEEDILAGLSGLKDELSLYCETSGINRLYDMRNSIDSLIGSVQKRGK